MRQTTVRQRVTLIVLCPYVTDMESDAAPRDETVDVVLSRELLRDIDAFAVRHGYENPSAVVREALEQTN